MPNIKSAKKRVLVNATKAAQNKAQRSELKTNLKKFDAAVAEGWLDLKVKNNTAYTFQIQISVDKYHMRGKVLSDAKLRTATG